MQGRATTLDELSAAARALIALPLAPMTRDMLNALQNPARRPPEPQVPVEPRLRHSHVAPVALCLSITSHAKAPPPARLTAAASKLARSEVPEVPERLRALPVRPQHEGRCGSSGAGDARVHGKRPMNHSPECRRCLWTDLRWPASSRTLHSSTARRARASFTTRKAARTTCNKAQEESKATH